MPAQTRRSFIRKLAAAGCGTALAPYAHISCSRGPGFDILIRDGRIADGLGAPLFAGNVGIAGGRIRSIGELAGARGRIEIDAANMIVAPGFVDIHSHSDEGLLRNPRAESKIRQGVTLDIGGNCSGSPFPEKKAGIEMPAGAAECTNYRDFVNAASGTKLALNAAMFIGQGTVRELVLGMEARPPDARELALMQDLVRAAMEQGAAGLSTGLEYMPSGYAGADEIIALCKVVAEHNGVYATHMRSEDEKLVEAVTEALRTARESGASLQISHLKAAGQPNWPKIDAVIELIEKARQDGLEVHCDRYPYLAYSTGLSIFLPGWALEGGREALVARLLDPATRRSMRKETLIKAEANGGWETVMISNLRREENRKLVGRRIDELAREAAQDPFEYACDLLAAEGGRVSIVGFGMSEANTDRIIALPYVMIASDGQAMSAEEAQEGGQPHPRSFGTFPRAIRDYVLDKKLVSMPEMIRKMTSMPADKLGFKDRGRIREDCHADLVVFDPRTIADRATYLEPWHYPDGIMHVLVNGVPVVSGGAQTDALPGSVLTRT